LDIALERPLTPVQRTDPSEKKTSETQREESAEPQPVRPH